MQIPLVSSWIWVIIGKINGKDDTKKVKCLDFMVSFNLWSVYRKINEVGNTISKLYFWSSLSEMIQENKLWNILQTKPSAKINPDNWKF